MLEENAVEFQWVYLETDIKRGAGTRTLQPFFQKIRWLYHFIYIFPEIPSPWSRTRERKKGNKVQSEMWKTCNKRRRKLRCEGCAVTPPPPWVSPTTFISAHYLINLGSFYLHGVSLFPSFRNPIVKFCSLVSVGETTAVNIFSCFFLCCVCELNPDDFASELRTCTETFQWIITRCMQLLFNTLLMHMCVFICPVKYWGK